MFAEIVEDPRSRRLCVISDRHAGIKNAMENLEAWQEPNAYHRFCLRHVKRNFATHFKGVSLKKMCWEIGSTTQQRKYDRLMYSLKRTNKQAWKYLKDIDRSKWTLLHDKKNLRWGNLTTNISESMNNVLRGARMLPIRASVKHTFTREVHQYVINYQQAYNCSTQFSDRKWTLFHGREIRAREHRVFPYSVPEQVFMVKTCLQTSDETGDSPYTVKFKKKTCTCGKWKIYRFPYSHAIAVCHYLQEDPKSIVYSRFHTNTYRAQYNNSYHPVSHKEDWNDAGWTLYGDANKITILRGRRRARRMRNKMDNTYAQERTGRLCYGCKQPGHMINNCPNRPN
ncbi:uncharacterized protein LOC143592162 [Bidens hawaiensis]|uniref:uncharacterized protein LOC143592162 n=1 Tax=Bidens hawaiensis TaxID=980011 RepID=UPI0040493B51